MSREKEYRSRPEWSYSDMKNILEHDIEYAVASKRGMLAKPSNEQMTLGTLIHEQVLGGEGNYILSNYDTYRTKEARTWREEQLARGMTIVSKDQMDVAKRVAERIGQHPRTSGLLKHANTKHEVELYAKTADGLGIKGKADAIYLDDDGATVLDLKTTAQFDRFAFMAQRNHYDLQAAVYTLITAKSLRLPVEQVDYWFCVAEAVEPYRVRYWYANLDFVEAGERKLAKCVEQILDRGDGEPDFVIKEDGELGDWSI